ncbi:hypothetical protein H181DRAFT_04204 [Streptomyces sp. WMMB 714]|jgi:hypothetical protein|uniref:hypothetical protein n=1 Tax=Streptomyces sp. WMMB 714 TaxID=1286822 RepID=UPI0005F86D38|nr:hypothetical protein [Streptomyces sp. WMMB 714]SCK46965.1 hypothetical protein H181DRAFT_04204 [Streptomyces sp. WMMB 714]
MNGKDAEQTDAAGHAPKPWWAGTGARGAAGLIALGILAALWSFFGHATGRTWLPLVPDEPASGYYQAAKIAAIGVVILASLWMHRRRTTASGERTDEQERG